MKVGFQTGLGSRREHSEWYTAYLYCRRCEDESDSSHKDWVWRVVIFHADGGNPTPLYGQKPRFDSIPEFLDWYSSWLDYLDLKELRKSFVRTLRACMVMMTTFEQSVMLIDQVIISYD